MRGRAMMASNTSVGFEWGARLRKDPPPGSLRSPPSPPLARARGGRVSNRTRSANGTFALKSPSPARFARDLSPQAGRGKSAAAFAPVTKGATTHLQQHDWLKNKALGRETAAAGATQ